MQLCPNCGQKNAEGLVFCEKCGVALSDVPIGTRQLGEESVPIAHSEKLGEEHIILLHVDTDPEPLMIQITASAILGRAGGETPTDPLINLADYDAEKKGVSRRHAMLIREDERLLITDLGSTNHTYLNGQQLQENDRLVLRDGDEIRLGKLSIKIFYK